nr:uncharacterized protein CTRU02_13700 [Colletotrichum truncatum]KAF6783048.1 hypothetical protein CTRU02_13700 [Colletotrichum truncatum]
MGFEPTTLYAGWSHHCVTSRSGQPTVAQSKSFGNDDSGIIIPCSALYSYAGQAPTGWAVTRTRVLTNFHSAPASDIALETIKSRFDVREGLRTPYNGPPTDPSVDEAWERLLKNYHIWVTRDELGKVGGYHSIPVPGTDGHYVGSFTVIHEIHCLKYMRQWWYMGHYFPNATEQFKKEVDVHFNHCLDVLRNSAICQADPTIWTLTWVTDSINPQVDFSQEHECRNWDRLNQWAGQRRIDKEDFFSHLEHPLYGRDTHKVPKNIKRQKIITDFADDGKIEIVRYEDDSESS